ncbi:MAG: hypothetical protein ACYSUS_04485 [Planctomycetota bacterium]|jgi:hypothetical protein
MRNTVALTISIVLTGLLIAGCGQVLQTRSIEIGGLMIRNQTAGPLYDIKLRVEQTSTVVSCNFIPAGGDFSTEFPLRRYQGNSVRVSWELYAELPEVLDDSSSAAAVVVIQENGVAVVRLEQ